MEMKKLGEKIQKARYDMGITSENLADEVSVSHTYMRQLESGIKTPSLPTFILLCQKLNVSPAFLLSGYLDNDSSDALQNLINDATPSQLDIIYSLIEAALKTITKDNVPLSEFFVSDE